MRMIGFSLICLCSVLAPTPCHAQAQTARDTARLYLDDALSLLTSRDTVAAVLALQQAAAKDPDYAEAHFLLGRVLGGFARTEAELYEAETHLLKALALDPENRAFLEALFSLPGRRGLTPAGERITGRLIERYGAARSADSVALADSARLWQARFEAFRREEYYRHRLGYRCDERVGRVCLSYLGDSTSQAGEPAAVDSARDELIAKLTAAADSEYLVLTLRVTARHVERLKLPGIPGDEWIFGQRIRYLVEDGRTDNALPLAKRCPITKRWWCSALEGYVHQADADLEAADSAFQIALSTLPVTGRRRWTDISPFLDGELREAYGSSSGERRDSLERRFWWLADPLYMIPVNDRKSEHFARNVMCRLQQGAQSGFGMRWGEDLRQIVLRHGWPIGWVFDRWALRGADRDAKLTASYLANGRRFLPSVPFLPGPDGDRCRRVGTRVAGASGDLRCFVRLVVRPTRASSGRLSAR